MKQGSTAMRLLWSNAASTGANGRRSRTSVKAGGGGGWEADSFGAGGTAVKGAAAATGWFGMKSAFDAGQDFGTWLFIAGILFYIVN